MAEGVLARACDGAALADRKPITLVGVTEEERIAELVRFAESYPDEVLGIKKALVSSAKR